MSAPPAGPATRCAKATRRPARGCTPICKRSPGAREDACVEVLEAKCLSNCAGGCSASIAMPGKWSYLLGGLEIENASDLLDYAAIYAASATGVVMPSRRPASLGTMVHGRIPALPDLSGNTA